MLPTLDTLYMAGKRLLGDGLLFYQAQADTDSTLAYARTFTVNAIVLGQILDLLNMPVGTESLDAQGRQQRADEREARHTDQHEERPSQS
jgi:hypothetical protein